MPSKKRITVLIALLVIVIVIVSLFLSRQWMSKQVYMRAGHQLSERLTPEQQTKYGEDLRYTLDKFWSFYEKGLISQNDLTDVVEKMKRLGRKREVENMELFDFIGYVSRIYTDAMHEYHEKTLTQ